MNIIVIGPFFLTIKAKIGPEIKKHIDNIWLLGGEIIRSINNDENLRKLESQSLVKKFVYEEGGPYCRHLDTEEELKSFDSTCKKLNKFLTLK